MTAEIEELEALLQEGYLVAPGILTVDRNNNFFSDIPPQKTSSNLKSVILYLFKEDKIAGSKMFYFSEPDTSTYLKPLLEKASQWSHYSVTLNFRTIGVPGLASGILDVEQVIPCVRAYIEAEPLTYEPPKGTLTFALDVSRDEVTLAKKRQQFADIQKALSIYYRRGFFVSDYQQVEKTRGVFAMLSGGYHEILPGFPKGAMDELMQTVQMPLAKTAVNYLYNFYLEPTIVGRIIVGWTALEELFGQKDRPERMFSNHDIRTLRKLIKKEFGATPAVYDRLMQRMADPTQFPETSLIERMKSNIVSGCDIPEPYVAEGIRKLRDTRNTVAHDAEIGTCDYRASVNFIEEILRRRLALLANKPLYTATGGPLVNPLGTYIPEGFTA